MAGRFENWFSTSFFLCLLIILQSACAEEGFLSIACCSESNSIDEETNLKYIPDASWFPIPKGFGTTCRNITRSGITGTQNKVRIFEIASGKRCYNLTTIRDQEYLIRGTFLLDDSPSEHSDSEFDVSVGVIVIAQVNSSSDLAVEGIFRARNNHIDFCLVHKKGDPYISKVELRPLNGLRYLNNKTSNVLKLVNRINAGGTEEIRYPDDPQDRIWKQTTNPDAQTISNSSAQVHNASSTVPLSVLRTGFIHSSRLEFTKINLGSRIHNYTVKLYFLELNSTVTKGQRVFDIYINNVKQVENFDILASGSNYQELSFTIPANGYLNLTLAKVTSRSNLGPICNGYEILQEHSSKQQTNSNDGEIKEELLISNKENMVLESWSGDPCLPNQWQGLSCDTTNGSWVVTKFVSSNALFKSTIFRSLPSKQLKGSFPTEITNLDGLRELNVSLNSFNGTIPEFQKSSNLISVDLSYNDFTGPLPESLASLPKLKKLYFRCNPLDAVLPSSLNSSRLDTDYGSCGGGDGSVISGQKIVIGTVTGGSLVATIAVGVIFGCFCKRKLKARRRLDTINHPMAKKNKVATKTISIQQFSLRHIEVATHSYKTMIGEGGFGSVFRGTLFDGQEVAVKVRSATSTQGTREFDNELTLLADIRHENLVPLLGYCGENDQQILVYPFMSNGSLQDRLYGEAAKRKVLDWPTRLSIALGAARGLTHLHTFGRCVIHRDVKSSNILLDHSMNARVADFGFSKYAPQDGDSGASLEVRGTAGYLDPEYYSTQHLSAKSDVFSFGVVLLEITSGREPLNIKRPRSEWSLVEWVKANIRESKIEEIVDPNIKGGYHAEAMWRVVEVALACVEPFSAYRPYMVDIVRELEDALIIENNASEYMRSIDSIYSLGGSNRYSIVIEKKITLPPTPSTAEPSPITDTQALVSPEPR
ncbi:hypothetical protein ACFE04_018685 [Oxalis oulophora]